MRIAFIDFEFGQIYGSWRRDFLITEVAVLIYNTKTNKIQIAEKIFKPLCSLVMRKRVKEKDGEIKLLEYLVHPSKNINVAYDNTYKIPKKDRQAWRIKWSKVYAKKLRTFLHSTMHDVDKVYVFGGNEDISLLQRYKVNIKAPIVDIQKILQRTYGIRYSLDRVAEVLNLNILKEKRLSSINYSYQLPKQNNIFAYHQKHLEAHHASGDCVLLFLVYMELVVVHQS